MTLESFPIISQLNKAREDCHLESHEHYGSHKSTLERVGYWFGHKGMTVVTVPTNIVVVCLGTAGFAAGSLILGSAKIFTYAITCGYIKPSFSTGALYCGERALSSTGQLFTNLGELMLDGFHLIADTATTCFLIAEKLQFGGTVRAIFEALGRGCWTVLDYTLFFAFRRLGEAFIKAGTEETPTVNFETPELLRPLDDAAKAERIDLSSNERSFGKIFKHTVISLANIPANAVTAVCSAVAFAALSSVFLAKVALYTVANVSIPLPTYIGKAGEAMLVSTANVAKDVSTDFADVFVVTYKTSDALGLNRVALTALNVIMYIPVAMFS